MNQPPSRHARLPVALVGLALLVALVAARSAAGYSSLSPEATHALGFHQHPGAALPFAAGFRDGTGHAVQLGNYFHGEPVVLVLEYLRCRTLCGLVLEDVASALARVPLAAGRDYQVVAISIDPRDGPADAQAARARYLAGAAPATSAGWHFLTGSPEAIRAVADAVGFSYRYDPAIDQYAHPAGITIATPGGRIARYILGLGYRPLDLRLALSEAATDRISSPVTDLLLLCYCYDPGTGRYSFAIRNVTRALCVATLLGLLALGLRLSRARRT